MNKQLETPCGPCPWKRKSAPGWLGLATAEHFLANAKATLSECHNSVDYTDTDWYLTQDWADCKGAQDFAENVATGSDIHPNVFASDAEFLAHHDVPANVKYIEAGRKIFYLRREVMDLEERLAIAKGRLAEVLGETPDG